MAKVKRLGLYKVDSYNVRGYLNERFVDVVRVDVLYKTMALCYSPKYMASVLIWNKDLRVVVGKEVI